MEHGENTDHNIAVVHLSKDDQGLAAGQFAAFYIHRTCVGSGVILESWDDQGFPICVKALEIAGMKDKSTIGKPVKIKVQPDTSQESIHLETSISKTSVSVRRTFTEKATLSSSHYTWLFSTTWLKKLGNKVARYF